MVSIPVAAKSLQWDDDKPRGFFAIKYRSTNMGICVSFGCRRRLCVCPSTYNPIVRERESGRERERQRAGERERGREGEREIEEKALNAHVNRPCITPWPAGARFGDVQNAVCLFLKHLFRQGASNFPFQAISMFKGHRHSCYSTAFLILGFVRPSLCKKDMQQGIHLRVHKRETQGQHPT
jgi:hypothetical protein